MTNLFVTFLSFIIIVSSPPASTAQH